MCCCRWCIEVTETIVVNDGIDVLPSAMFEVTETITVDDTIDVLPSAMLAVIEAIVVDDGIQVLPSLMLVVYETIAVDDGVGLVLGTPPQLTLPANVTSEAVGPAGAVVTFAATALMMSMGRWRSPASRRPVPRSPSARPPCPGPRPMPRQCGARDVHGHGRRHDSAGAVAAGEHHHERVEPRGRSRRLSGAGNRPGCGSADASCSPASGATFAIGVTTVTCTAADPAGNTRTGSFTVTVPSLLRRSSNWLSCRSSRRMGRPVRRLDHRAESGAHSCHGGAGDHRDSEHDTRRVAASAARNHCSGRASQHQRHVRRLGRRRRRSEHLEIDHLLDRPFGVHPATCDAASGARSVVGMGRPAHASDVEPGVRRQAVSRRPGRRVADAGGPDVLRPGMPVRQSGDQHRRSAQRRCPDSRRLLSVGVRNSARNLVVQALEEANGALRQPGHAVGYPTFVNWPRWNDITHQKMWVDWIRRARDGGLRVMVSLSHNNRSLAEVIGAGGPISGVRDDKSSSNLQIDEIKAFVGRHADLDEGRADRRRPLPDRAGREDRHPPGRGARQHRQLQRPVRCHPADG